MSADRTYGNCSMCTGMVPPADDDPDPWAAGGKFIESGLEPVEEGPTEN